MLNDSQGQLPEPILTSILDTDAYKLHMQQAVFHYYNDITVAAEFRCRNSEKLGQYQDEIQYQIKQMQYLALTDDEYHYLSHLPFFQSDYLNWLKDFRYNPAMVNVQNIAGELTIRIEGKWIDVILWEVPLLAVISEIVHRHRTPNINEQEALIRLQEKLERFKQNTAELDMSQFNLVDFGTRRRYSAKVQQTVVNYLKSNFKYFQGTSNYYLAYKLALSPVGTQAHEWFQAHQQISDSLADCQRQALQVWLNEYPHDLGIALTDCITMNAFLRDFDADFANSYQGLRHDSGDPITWGEKAIEHYIALGIDPKQKTLVFSDSLNLDKALVIYRHFQNRIKLYFGIGGHLTCDLPITSTSNTKTLNIVIKLVECKGKPVAKLSDSPGKTISQDRAFINQLKKAFDVLPQ